jgi:hypothetical protein
LIAWFAIPAAARFALILLGVARPRGVGIEGAAGWAGLALPVAIDRPPRTAILRREVD